MRRLFAIFLFLPFASFGATKGWVCVIELSEFKCDVGGTNPDGSIFYVGQLTGRKARQERYVAGSYRPSLADFGTDYYRDLAGNQKPPTPYTYPFVIWQVSGYQTFGVNDSLQGADFSGLGNLNLDKYLSPVYVASPNDPYSFTLSDGYYSGVNSNFGSHNGPINIVQGQIGPSNSSIPNGYYYDPNNGSLIITDSPNSNMGTYNWDSASGEYVYTPAVQASGDINLSPVVSAIEIQGGLTRSQLLDLLGSNGNSWVYDCKLSLAQLYSLASSQGLLSSSDSQHLDYIDSNISTITPAVLEIANKDFSPTINVAAPNVTVNPPEVNVNPQVNVDTSSLAQENTLQAVLSNQGSAQTELEDLNAKLSNVRSQLSSAHTIRQSINGKLDLLTNFDSSLTSIFSILNSWNTGNDVPSTLPQPDLGDDAPNDKLPSFAHSAWSADGVASDSSLAQVYGDMVDWGDNGTPTTIVPDFVSGFLSSFVGSIPSVGSDPNMFDFSIELPYVGLIEKHWSWSDFPYVSDFRAFLVWLVYLFFGLACFKLLHKTMI